MSKFSNYILCIDDEKTVLDVLHQQLNTIFGANFRYEVAQSADEAWEVIEDITQRGDRIVLVISDWLMPRVKGDEFLVQFHQKFPASYKIMLTGQADAQAINNAKKNANLHAYMPKPWSLEDLKKNIDACSLQGGPC